MDSPSHDKAIMFYFQYLFIYLFIEFICEHCIYITATPHSSFSNCCHAPFNLSQIHTFFFNNYYLIYVCKYVCVSVYSHTYILMLAICGSPQWSLFAAKEAFLMRGESYTDQAGDSTQALAVIKSQDCYTALLRIFSMQKLPCFFSL